MGLNKRNIAKNRLCRRMGENLWGRDKCPVNKNQTGPGQHGARRKKLTGFGIQLREKQKLKGYYVNIGERVEDRPLLRLAMLDPLRVELVLPANRYGTVARNDALSVQPELPNAPVVTARVTHVDKVIDAASNTFRVRLELPNPSGAMPAGLRCKIDLALKLPETQRATPSAAADRPGTAP